MEVLRYHHRRNQPVVTVLLAHMTARHAHTCMSWRWILAQVLLTHSYHLGYDPKQLRKMQPYTPIGTLYAASALREAGISVAVFDSMLDDPLEGFRWMLEKHQPKIVAVYEDDFNFLIEECALRG